MQQNNVKFYTGLSLMHFGDVACLYTCSYYQASQVFHIHTCMHTTCSRTHTDGFYSDPDYFRSHDHLGYIGADRNATIAATSMYIPPSMFNLPMPPPQHYNQVWCTINFVTTHKCTHIHRLDHSKRDLDSRGKIRARGWY